MKVIMKNKPIIGIIGKVQPKHDEDLWHRIDEVDEIRYLIVKIGICAGFNNILRALGGDVIVDKTKIHDIYDKNYRHKIEIEKDTELYKLVGKEEIDVNSIHSMIATKESVEPYAKISSYSKDGLVESFELPNKKFVMGIKWHSELLLNEKYIDDLFKKFISNC